MKKILINFDREKKQLTGTRGLQNDSNDQIFIMKINQSFRKHYELLFRNYYVRFCFVNYCLPIDLRVFRIT